MSLRTLMLVVFLAAAVGAFPVTTRADVPVTWDEALPTWDEGLNGPQGSGGGILGGLSGGGASGLFGGGTKEGWFVSKEFEATFSIDSLLGGLDDLIPSGDAAMRILGQQLTRQITHSVADWIRDGQFDGGPLFTTSLEDHLTSALDEVSGIFISQLDSDTQNLLCSPFKLQIRLQIGLLNDANSGRSNFHRRNACTASDVLSNVDRMRDFKNVGWENWLKINQPNNNMYGSLFLAEDEYNQRLAAAQRSQENQYLAGQGSIGKRECLEEVPETRNPSTGRPYCARYQTVIPGSTALATINQQLSTDAQSSLAADEANEIATALLERVFSELGLSPSVLADLQRGLNKK